MIARHAPSLITFVATLTAAVSFSAAGSIHYQNVALLKDYDQELASLEHALQSFSAISADRRTGLSTRLAEAGIVDSASPDDHAVAPGNNGRLAAPVQDSRLGDGPAATTQDKPRSSVTITNPANNALVAKAALATGTFDSSIAGDIWVFVWPELAPGKGWPQTPNAADGAPAVLNKQTSIWSTPVGFGGPPQSYEIAVYTASKPASARIGRLLKNWAKRGDYPGMTLNQLDGLVERHRITVRKP